PYAPRRLSTIPTIIPAVVPALPMWEPTPRTAPGFIFQVNPSTGALTQLKVFPTTTNPSWLTFDPQKKNLYVVNEISNFNGGTTGSVSAYTIDKATGNLTFLHTVSSGGAGPAHA